jgi:hypothetical protein
LVILWVVAFLAQAHPSQYRPDPPFPLARIAPSTNPWTFAQVLSRSIACAKGSSGSLTKPGRVSRFNLAWQLGRSAYSAPLFTLPMR